MEDNKKQGPLNQHDKYTYELKGPEEHVQCLLSVMS